MYKVFLVDDEIVVREGIRSNFPWDDTNFTLSGEAPDGEMALSMLQDIKPDILITDIRMPFMDGLSLCRVVTRTMPWIYIIILSGYDDFSYAREAISLGVKEYLLKPVSGQELLAVLNRIASRIEEDKRQQANLRTFREHFASSSRFLKEKLISDLLNGIGSDDALNRARALQMNLHAQQYSVMLVHFQPNAQDENPKETLLNVQSILHRLSDGSGGTAHICEVTNGFALLVLGDNAIDIEERAYGLAQAMQYDVERNTQGKLLVGIGESVDTPETISLSYRDATAVMAQLNLQALNSSAKRIMSMQDVATDSDFALLTLDKVPTTEQLRHATLEDIDKILDHYTAGMGTATQSIMIANYMFVDIMLAVSRLIKECGGTAQEVIPDAFKVRARGYNTLSANEVLPLTRDMLTRAIAFRDAQGSARYGSVIRQAKAFIAENFHDSNITLHDVASHVALSNNHFCTVFSQEMGVTFTEYLTATRIARAKELLSGTTLRTSEVAYQVGYNDPHYFSYLFKKNTGLSPRDFRKDV